MIHRSPNDTDVAEPEQQPVTPAAGIDDDPIDDGFNPYGSGPVPITRREEPVPITRREEGGA